jgi:hypothetical protein
MTTPASGQISLGDLKSELSLVGGASSDISLNDCNSNIMANGFYDTYGYSRIGINTQVPLSNFYSLETDAEYELRVGLSITDYNQFDSVLFNESRAGGTAGAQAQPDQFPNPGTPTNPAFVNGVGIVHCDEVSITLNAQNTAGPPFNQNLYIEYSLDNGSTYTAFTGSPFSGPSINLNGGVQNNAPNNVGTARFTVQCYQ